MKCVNLISYIKLRLKLPEIATSAIAMAQMAVAQLPPGLTSPKWHVNDKEAQDRSGPPKMPEPLDGKVPEYDMTTRDDQEAHAETGVMGSETTQVFKEMFTSGPVLVMP